MEHYRIGDGLMFTTTRKVLQALYIPKGHAANGETLRELIISEVHNKGHHSAERNPRYATEYLYWPEMRKDWRDYVRQCEHCQRTKERNRLPEGNADMMRIPREIFTSYAIDFAKPFNKSKGPTKADDMVFVVVDRAVGFTWFIPTTADVNSETTLSNLRHYLFTPHGTPTSIVSDADPWFTSHFWQQCMKAVGIEHIKAVPGHYETNGQVERKIRELKTALRNITNKRENNWVNSLQDMAAYTNAGHSDTINMSPYKAVYGGDYPILATYRIEGTAVLASEDDLNRHQEQRNDAYQALKLARIRSTRVAAKRRTTHKPMSIGEFLIVYGDRFATEYGRSKKLERRWQGPFQVLDYNEQTQNYTVKMDSKICRRKEAVFHCSMVKKFFFNNRGRFPGRTHAKPAPILVEEMPEWEVEEVQDHLEHYGKAQFLVQWKGYPNSDNSWEPLECLENAIDLVQAWWTDNMPGDKFPVETGFITMSYTPTRPSWTQFEDEGPVDSNFCKPYFESQYDDLI